MVHHRRVHLIGVHKSTQHGRARTLVLQTIRGERDNHYATVPKIQNCAAEVNNFHNKKNTHTPPWTAMVISTICVDTCIKVI